jgi:hypothetical protein
MLFIFPQKRRGRGTTERARPQIDDRGSTGDSVISTVLIFRKVAFCVGRTRHNLACGIDFRGMTPR